MLRYQWPDVQRTLHCNFTFHFYNLKFRLAEASFPPSFLPEYNLHLQHDLVQKDAVR